MYIATILNKEADVKSFGITQAIELSWINGQIGAMPVFGTKEDALKYVNGDENLILEISTL